MLADKTHFGLDGIDPKTFESIKKNFSSGGSNNPIATIVWYVNLLKLKHEFNPDAIDFPVVFDSPNNAETDQEKKNQVYQYICERITDNQLIVSGIGFRDMPIPNVEFDKVIELDNPKYGLLIEKDFTSTITKPLAVLGENGKGYTKEANFISWNGNAAKLDIREWHPNHERCGKGITLTEDEGRNLYDALKALCEKE